jgi:AcrR family transcriptional regulator
VPRKADPNLEHSILEAALRLYEQGGADAVTMRAVAKAARTTTPTLYERFRDREALLEAITDSLRNRLISTLNPDDSLEGAGAKFLVFCRAHPYAIDLLVNRVASNLKAKKKGPVYDLVRNNLIKLHGFSPDEAEEIAMATSSMMAGTALLISRIGPGTSAAKNLERATLMTMRRLSASAR